MNKKCVTKTGLRERGWTESLVAKFLPVPDVTKPNPHYRKAAALCLYSVERVVKVEETDEFRIAQQKSQVRKIAAKKGAKSRSIGEVPRLTQEKLFRAAIDHYNLWAQAHSAPLVSDQSEASLLLRIAVNYLRDEMIGPNRLNGAKLSVRSGLNRKALPRIYKVYPYLREECARLLFEDLREIAATPASEYC